MSYHLTCYHYSAGKLRRSASRPRLSDSRVCSQYYLVQIAYLQKAVLISRNELNLDCRVEGMVLTDKSLNSLGTCEDHSLLQKESFLFPLAEGTCGHLCSSLLHSVTSTCSPFQSPCYHPRPSHLLLYLNPVACYDFSILYPLWFSPLSQIAPTMFQCADHVQ